MSGLAQASCRLTRVRDANFRPASGRPRNRTKYSYDANGNATARQGNSIVWSSYNYPTTVNAGSGSTAETVAFSYGPDRKRWQQMYTGNGTSETTNYVGGLMDVVSSASTTTYRHYVYAGSEPVAVYARSSAGNTFSYVLSDHQGSNSDLTNSSGASIVNESFTPFGQRRNPTTWSGAASNSDLTTAAGITRQGYTFQTQLGLWMGMNHMNGRVEDAITGRMLSADPHVPDRTNPQSYNRYTYVNNNPLTSTDPSGFCSGGVKCLPINGVGYSFGLQCQKHDTCGDIGAGVADLAVEVSTSNAIMDFEENGNWDGLNVNYGVPSRDNLISCALDPEGCVSSNVPKTDPNTGVANTGTNSLIGMNNCSASYICLNLNNTNSPSTTWPNGGYVDNPPSNLAPSPGASPNVPIPWPTKPLALNNLPCYKKDGCISPVQSSTQTTDGISGPSAPGLGEQTGLAPRLPEEPGGLALLLAN
jgi:RHS repeat-associated protein